MRTELLPALSARCAYGTAGGHFDLPSRLSLRRARGSYVALARIVEQFLKQIAADTALAVEAIAVVLIAYGAAEALVTTLGHVFHGRSIAGWRKQLFVRFGVWLLLGLQFALAADIVRSVISPTWEDIGELAAIAGIRAFLNYFLEKDLEEASHADESNAVSV